MSSAAALSNNIASFRKEVRRIASDLMFICDLIDQDVSEDRSFTSLISRYSAVVSHARSYIVSKKFNSDLFSTSEEKLIPLEASIVELYAAIETAVPKRKLGTSMKNIELLRHRTVEILHEIRRFRAGGDLPRPNSQNKIPLDIIPTEIPAPIRVTVTEDRINLTAPKHKSGQLADKSIEAFRRSACGILEEIIDELSQPTSNADRRLNPRLKSLLRELSVPLPDMAVEAVGLQWQVTIDVIAATNETVPEALLSQIQRILSTIRNLLSQFEEWHEYESVTIAETIKTADVQDLTQIGDEIAVEIAANCEVIDNQIGDRLHDMAVALSSGLVKRETIITPLVGSLSNLFAGVAQVVIEHGSFIINPAINIFTNATDPTTLGRGVVLIGFCSFIMQRFAPRLMEYAPFNWLKTILPTALKYYSALSKSGKA